MYIWYVKGGGGDEIFFMIFIYLSFVVNIGIWKKCFVYLFYKSIDIILFFKLFIYKSGDVKIKFLFFIILLKFIIFKVVFVNVDL